MVRLNFSFDVFKIFPDSSDHAGLDIDTWPDACFKAVGPVRATGFLILLDRWASGFNQKYIGQILGQVGNAIS